MNRILRSQFPSKPSGLAVFDTTTGSSPGRTRWSNGFSRWVVAVTFILGFMFNSSVMLATTCPSATDIPAASLPVVSQAITCGATNDITAANVAASMLTGGCNSGNYYGGFEALYTFTPTATGLYDVSIAGQTYTSIFVTNGCPTTAGATCVGGVSSSGSTKNVTLTLTAGITYYIMFDTWPTPNSPCPGTFSMAYLPPNTITSTAFGGLWNNAATWVGGVVPNAASTVTIAAGAAVTVDVAASVVDLTINGTLQWNGTANAMTVNGNVLVNSGASFLPYTTAGTTGVSLNIVGNLTNNGYINMAAGATTQGTINFNGSGSTISGTGTFQGDGTNGIIRILQFSNTGANVINTSQNLVVYDLRLDGGSLNTNGKVISDNTKMVYGLPFNTGIASISVTGMGTGYTAAPMLGPTGATRWPAASALTANQVRMWNGNIYVVTVAGTSGAAGPTHTSGTAVDGGATLLWVGTAGTLGTAFMSAASHTVGTFYFYGDNLYICTTAGAGSAASPPTHTSGIANAGAAAFKYVGTVAKASAVWDATTGTVRAINITQAGSGYSTTAPGLVIVADQTAAPTAAAATVVLFQSIIGPANSVARRSPGTTITGGLTINSNSAASALSSNNPQALSGVDFVYTTNGGNYNNTSTPNVGFTLPNNLNLVTEGGSGCTTPAVTVTGGTSISGTPLTPTAFNLTWSNGSVVSVYCGTPGTATYSVPPTIAVTGCTTAPTLAWPVNCLPTATVNMSANGMIQSFTITNKGYGYNAAPTVGLSTLTPGPTATPTTPVARLGLYNYTIAVNSPTTAASAAVVAEDAFIPSNRTINTLSLSTNAAGLNVTGGNLTLIGSAPLSLTATTAGNILDLGGNTILFPWNQYGGLSGTYNNAGGTKAFVKNGSIEMNGRGGNTWNFPFAGSGTSSVQIFTGTTNALTNTTNIVSAKISDLGAPTNTTSGGTGWAIGNRSFRINTTTLGGGVGTAGNTATIRLPWNELDGLTTTQDLTFVSEAPAASGAWTLRSAAVGASGALAAAGTLTTGIAVPGPATLANGNVYAFSSLVPTVTSIDVTSLCAFSGSFTITGTNLTGVTSVTIGGVPVFSLTVVNSTTITGYAGAVASGFVVVTNGVGASGTGSQAVTVNASPSAPTVSVAAQTITMGSAANVTATGNGGTFNWYTQPAGGVSVLTGATLNLVVCSTTTYYVAESNGTCEGARTAVVITVTFVAPTITSSVASFCGTGGEVVLTASNLMDGAIATWTSLTAGATLSAATGVTTNATLTVTSDFKLSTTVTGCPTPDAFVSIGVYPLPTATVTTTASGVCPGTSATINSGLSAGNFSVLSIPYLPFTVPANATTIVSNGVPSVTLSGGSLDDGGWGGIPIGFNFNFFGNSYSTLGAGTNGLLMFGTIPGYTTAAGNLGQYNFNAVGGVFPNLNNPGNVIALMAGDQYFGSGAVNSASSDLIYWTEGYAPNRKFVILYRDVNRCCGAANAAFTAYAVLYETLGMVDIHILNNAQAGSSNTVGLQDLTKTIGAVAPGRQNFTTAITTPEAWRFNPPANYLTIWTATDVNGTTPLTTSFGGAPIPPVNGFSAIVAPLLTTQYSISYANATTGCSNALTPAQVTMAVLGTTAPQGVATATAATTVCPGSSITLSTNYTGLPDGLTFQWEISTNGGTTWADIAGANAITLTTTFTGNASYRLKFISCGGTPSFSTPVAISVPSYTCPSCTTFASNTDDEEIYSFTLNTSTTPAAYAGLNGCSTVAPGAGSLLSRYSNFTSLGSFANLISGVTNTITVQQDECDGPTYFSNGFAAFIDYNHDGDFTDVGEKVYNDGAVTSAGPRAINGTFVVPADAIPGQAVMRIMVVEGTSGSAITPCLTYFYGETEDYIVTINPPCNPATFILPLASADDPTVCGNQTSQLTAFDLNGLANPIYMWYTAPTGGTLLQSSTSNFFTPPAISATTTWYVATNTGSCVTDRFPVTLNWSAAPSVSLTNSNPTSCGTVFTPTNIGTTSANSGYAYTWSASPALGSGILPGTTGATLTGVTPSLNGIYNVTASAVDAISGCTTTASSLVGFYAPLTGNATVTQPAVCGGNGSVNFAITGTATVFASDFSSATLNPLQAELCNNAAIAGGQLQLTPPVNSQKGGILITNTTGLATNDFQIDFDMITTAGTTPPADGFSYSYGPDVVCMPTPVGAVVDNTVVASGAANPENGSGSGIRLSFDAYTNGVNVNGIYLMYNCPRINPSSTLTPAEGLYYYANNTSWIGGANTHVTIKINALGQMSMWLAGTQVLNNAQLPADYLTANKTTWKHAFAARTGGLNQGHAIDNLDIHYNNFYEYSVDNGTTWTTNSPVSVPSPSTVQNLARYVTQPACSVDLGSTSVLFPVPVPTAVTGASACLNAPAVNVSAFGPPLGGTLTATTSLGTSLTLPGSGTLSLTGTVNVPVGAVITGAVLSVAGITTTGATFASDITVGMTGVSSLSNQPLSSDFGVTNVSYSYNATIPSANGGITVNFSNGWTGAATFASVSLIVSYQLPSLPSWYSGSTPSAANFIGTGTPFNVLGTSVLASTAATTTSTIYAATQVVNGASTCYSTSVPASILIGVPLTATVNPTTTFTSTTTLGSGPVTLPFGTSSTVSGTVSLPAGAVVTGTQLLINGVTSTNFTYDFYIQVAASGATTLGNQSVGSNFVMLTSPTNYTFTPSNIANTGGTVFVTLSNTGFSGQAAISSVQLVVTYTGPVLTSICPGATVGMSVSTSGGGGAQTYQWNLNGTPIVGATASSFGAVPGVGNSYTCTVSDACNPAGVVSSAYVPSFFSVTAGTITGPSALNVNDFASTPPGGGTYVLSGQTAGSTIQWIASNTGSAPWTNIGGANSATQPLFAAGAAGILTLSANVTSPDGCSAQANIISVAMGNAIDTPCTARPVTLGNQGGLVFSTAAATVDGGEVFAPATGCNVQTGWCNSTLNGTVWFSFVAPASGRVSIAAPGWDNQLAIYSASNCADYSTFALINANDDAGGLSAILTDVKCLTPGATYYIQLDAYGTVGSTTLIITDLGNTAPVITNVPANITVSNNTGVCGATPSWTAPTVTDDQGCVTTISNFSPGALLPLGVTTITYTSTDVQGLTATASFTVTVTDNELPVVVPPATVTVTAALNACTATATLGTATTSDNCSVATLTNNATGTYPIGNTTVIYTVTDVNGNVGTATQTVTVLVNPANIWYVDADGDGYGAGATVTACSQPVGYSVNSTDCNDANVNVNPGEVEVCGNAIDDNCNGLSEEGCTNPGENPNNATSMSTSVWPNCNLVNGTLVNANVSGSAQTICLTGEDKWHQFVSTSEGVSIVVNSSSSDIVIELQTAAGVLVAQENAVAGIGGEILNHYGLTAGQVYKVGVRNYNSALGTGTYSICVKMLKRGGCDYGPGPYSLCQYFKATWAGAAGTSYTFTYTGITGPAAGNVYTRTQNSDICILGNVSPTLPYGSTYNVLISNTYTLNNGAGVAETINVPALAPCSMSTIAQPVTALRTSDRCTTGPRFRGSVVASLPWVCGATNWRWEFTELNAQGQPVGLPIAVNRGAASNYLSLGSVLQLQYGKTYSVRTAPILSYTGTNYQWGTTFCMSIVGSAGMVVDGSQAATQTVRMETTDEVNMSLYPNPTHGTDVNINLSGVDSDNVQIRVVDAMGRQVWSNRYSVSGVLNTNITFERPLANGLYMVEAIFNGEVQTQRMMVQK